MKREIEALDRALLNMLSAHDRKIERYHEIMREIIAAAQGLIGGMNEFADGHYVLYDDLHRKAREALSRFEDGLRSPSMPPPIPRNEIFDRFEADLQSFEQGGQPLQ